MTAFFPTDAAVDPLAGFDLDTLLGGAARLRGGSHAVSDGEMVLDFATLDAKADALALRLADLGLAPGDTLLVLAGARVAPLLALVGGLRAGLRVALAPLHLDADELAARARACEARAILAEPRYGLLTPVETAFLAAAEAPRVRLVGSLVTAPGRSGPEGAVVLDIARLGTAENRTRPDKVERQPIVTFDADGTARETAQRTLVAAALDLVARARIGMRLQIFSTLAPASFAGLVAGPFASLLAGAPLHLHGPFDAARFAETLGRPAPCHLVIPGALLPMLRTARLAGTDRLASLLLFHRRERLGDAVPDSMPGPLGRLPPALDLHAIGEEALIAELRDGAGLPAPLCGEPHYINLDEGRLLAVGLAAGPDGPVLEGAAVRGALRDAEAPMPLPGPDLDPAPVPDPVLEG